MEHGGRMEEMNKKYISLAEKHPELIPEWDESNGDLTPWNVSYGSHKKVTWKGKCGHTWKAIVKDRSRGCGCPSCSKKMVVKGVNDLATIKPELVEEWSDRNLPLTPSDFTSRSGINVWWKCKTCGYEWWARIADRVRRGCGCPNCLKRVFKTGYTDLATIYPELAEEWSDRNGDLKPTAFWPSSKKIVWWKCKTCCYEWQAVIYNRVKGEAECPSCADRVVNPGFNDLETVCPDLVGEWDYERNGNDTPDKVLATSKMFAYWKDYYGHMWRAKVFDRTMGMGCPYCSPDWKRVLKLKSIVYYINRSGYTVSMGNSDIIGIPIEIYIPEKRTAIEIAGKRFDSGAEMERENTKNWLCIKAGIKLFRVVRPMQKEFDNCICISLPVDSYIYFEEVIKIIFEHINIPSDIDIARDYKEIMNICLEGGMELKDEKLDIECNTSGTWNTAMASHMLPYKPKT